MNIVIVKCPGCGKELEVEKRPDMIGYKCVECDIEYKVCEVMENEN